MTAHGIPDDPLFATESERLVCERLLKQGHDDWTVLANVRLTDEKKDHELDLIVLMPEVGIVDVDVKGGDPRVENGNWVVGAGIHERVVHPVDQGRAVNERMPRERSRERLYVALSRATDELVVGPADVIREMGGPAVARKLGIQ